MKAKDIMTPNPKCCTAQASLQSAARMMRDCNCGEIPVIEGEQTIKPIGVITDRDITCRAVAPEAAEGLIARDGRSWALPTLLHEAPIDVKK